MLLSSSVGAVAPVASMITEPEAFAGFLKLQLNGANIHVRDCIFTLPADKLMTREVVLPDLADARIRQIIETNAAEYFPINLSDYVLGFYRIAAVRKTPEKTEEAAAGEGTDELAGDRDIELTDLAAAEDKKGKKKMAETAVQYAVSAIFAFISQMRWSS